MEIIICDSPLFCHSTTPTIARIFPNTWPSHMSSKNSDRIKPNLTRKKLCYVLCIEKLDREKHIKLYHYCYEGYKVQPSSSHTLAYTFMETFYVYNNGIKKITYWIPEGNTTGLSLVFGCIWLLICIQYQYHGNEKLFMVAKGSSGVLITVLDCL